MPTTFISEKEKEGKASIWSCEELVTLVKIEDTIFSFKRTPQGTFVECRDQWIYALFCPAPPRGFSLSPRPTDLYPCPSPPRPTEKCCATHIPGIQPAQYALRYPPASAALRPRLRPCRLKPPSAPARSCQGCTWTLIVSKLSGSLPSCSPASSASPFLSPPHPCPPPMWSGTTLSSPLTKRNNAIADAWATESPSRHH